ASDREDNLWMGTEYDGLLRLRDAVFTSIMPEGEERVTSVFEDAGGTLWIGVVGGLLREKDGGLVPVPGATGATSFAEDAQGTIWIGHNQGLARRQADRLVPVDGLAGTGVVALLADPDGTLWIGSRANGVYRYAGGQLSHFTPA